MDFFSYFTTLYLVNLGASNLVGFSGIIWVFYVMLTILNPIIMVNLLISILGGTYGDVKDEEVVDDAQELISLILEAEMLLFWRRGSEQKSFLHVCDRLDVKVTGSDETLLKKIKNVKTKITGMIKSLDKEHTSIDAIQAILTSRNSTINDLIEKFELKMTKK